METSDSVTQNEIALLKADIERLNEELKTATSEKIQSAQYGLVLLVSAMSFCDWLCLRVYPSLQDEKEELQKKYDELEAKYEFEKKDFEDLSEVCSLYVNLSFQSKHFWNFIRL